MLTIKLVGITCPIVEDDEEEKIEEGDVRLEGEWKLIKK
tara:strand:+ start:2345 stop:2461 length:117 start_codon:yes stop_codon:yes gene_type:complete